uniref:(northern house mosquito) hypothetical protein n=1 Tax=Culex pipiens TaxID=7175 RepID=A0A8D8AL27_CULPI
MCSSTVAGVSSHEFQSFSTTFLYRAESRTTLTELRASPGPVPADEGRRRREKQHSNFLNRATMVSSRWRTRVMTSWLSILFFRLDLVFACWLVGGQGRRMAIGGGAAAAGFRYRTSLVHNLLSIGIGSIFFPF